MKPQCNFYEVPLEKVSEVLSKYTNYKGANLYLKNHSEVNL
jgi:hypothetical protein